MDDAASQTTLTRNQWTYDAREEKAIRSTLSGSSSLAHPYITRLSIPVELVVGTGVGCRRGLGRVLGARVRDWHCCGGVRGLWCYFRDSIITQMPPPPPGNGG